MGASRLRTIVMVGASALVAIASFAGGVLFLAGHGSVDLGGRPMELGVGVTLLVASVAMVIGMWRFSRSQRSGHTLVAVGALPVAICFWWTGVVPAVAIPVAIASVVRGRRTAREPSSDSRPLAAS